MKLRKIINVLTLVVMVSVNVITPISYADTETGDLVGIENPIIEQSAIEEPEVEIPVENNDDINTSTSGNNLAVENPENLVELAEPKQSLVPAIELGDNNLMLGLNNNLIPMSGLNSDIDDEHGTTELSGGDTDVMRGNGKALVLENLSNSYENIEGKRNILGLNPTASFNANGGEVVVSEIESDNDGNITLPNATRSDLNGNWVFEGWFTSPGYSEKFGNSGDIIKLMEDTTLYAHWAQTITIFNPYNPFSGLTIMDRNLGAVDVYNQNYENPSTGSYGYHYQWGNNYGFLNDVDPVSNPTQVLWKQNYDNSNYTSPVFITKNYDYRSNGNFGGLWGGSGDSLINNHRGLDNIGETLLNRQGPCPVGYHVPSIGEWNTLIDYYRLRYNSEGGNSSRRTINDLYSSEYNDPIVTGFMNYFRLPFAGQRGYYQANLYGGLYGYYWSSSPNDGSSRESQYLIIEKMNDGTYMGVSRSWRANGYSVRCFKNKYDRPITYSLTFNSYGGNELSSVNVEKNAFWSRPKDPTRIGSNFVNWYTSTGYDEVFDFSKPAIGDVTIYAKWKCRDGYKMSDDGKSCETAYKSIILGDDPERNVFQYKTITITGSDGKEWILMDRNLGAKEERDGITWNESTDADYYGYYYQWGNNYGFSAKTTNTSEFTTEGQVTVSTGSTYYNSKWNKTQPWSIQSDLWGYGGTEKDRQGPCPKGWRVPSRDEWKAIYDAWNTRSDKSTDKGSTTNNFAYDLKLPPAAERSYSDLSFSWSRGSIGRYWSSMSYDDEKVYYFFFSSAAIGPYYTYNRSVGLSVRCLKNIPQPVTVTYNLNGGYWTESGSNYANSRQITYAPDLSGNYDVGTTYWRTPSKLASGETGWMFDGWYLSNGARWTGDVITLGKNVTVYAHWLPFKDMVVILSGTKITIMDRNLGATEAGTGCSDINTGSCGYHFQWGNNYGFKSDGNSSSGFPNGEIITKDKANNLGNEVSTYYSAKWVIENPWNSTINPNLWGGESSSNPDTDKQGPCPAGYHIPDRDEWGKIRTILNNSQDGDYIRDTFNMPFAGYRNESATGNYIGSYGLYWMSSPYRDHNAYNLYFYTNYIHWYSPNNRSSGRSVRCFKNYPKIVVYHPNGGAFSGMEINETKEYTYNYSGSDIIPIYNIQIPNRISKNLSQQSGWMFDGWYTKSGENNDWGEEFNPEISTETTVYAKWLPFNDLNVKDNSGNIMFTVMDRNLGAINNDITTTGSYGHHYQWGNNYGFQNTGTLTNTSLVAIDASEFGPGNYYSSSKFTRGSSYTWDSSYNKNLWGGSGDTTSSLGGGTDEDRQGPCPVGYHVPSTLEWRVMKEVWCKRNDGSTTCTNGNNFSTDLLLPFVGYRNIYVSELSVANNSSYGYYRSSTRNYAFFIGSSEINPQVSNYMSPAMGFSIRCIKNSKNFYTLNFYNLDQIVSTKNIEWRNPVSDSLKPENPVRDNASFVGWYENNGDEAFEFGSSTYLDKDTNLYAKFKCDLGYVETQDGTTCEKIKVNLGTNGGKFSNGENILSIEPSIIHVYKNITKSSHSPNVADDGESISVSSNVSTGFIQIEGANELNVLIKYSGSPYCTNSAGPIGIRGGEQMNHVANNPNDLATAVRSTSTFPDYGSYVTEEFTVSGNSVNIAQGGGCPSYGWYVTVSGTGIEDFLEYSEGVFDNIEEPIREGYTFKGWYLEDGTLFNSLNVSTGVVTKVYAQWEENKSNNSSNSSGGGKKTTPTTKEVTETTDKGHNSADEKENTNTSEVDKTILNNKTSNQVISVTKEVSDDGTEVEVVVETVAIKNTNIIATVRTETPVNGTNSNIYSSATHTKEQADAYSFAKSNGITTTESIETAKMNTELTRIQMAKMLSNFAINVLGQEPDTEKGTVEFKDVTTDMDKEYDNAVTKSYQLGIMGQNVKDNKFRPNDGVSRAEFSTALSRLLYNTEEGKYKGTNKYYIPHIVKLYNEGIINKAEPSIKEKRGYVMTMLMRTVK